MKVRCTNDKGWVFSDVFIKKWPWSKKKNKPWKGPKKGDIVTVVNEYWNDGEKWYRLMEWPVPNNGGYNSKHFTPIDEEQAKFEEVTYSEIKKEVPVSAN